MLPGSYSSNRADFVNVWELVLNLVLFLTQSCWSFLCRNNTFLAGLESALLINRKPGRPTSCFLTNLTKRGCASPEQAFAILGRIVNSQTEGVSSVLLRQANLLRGPIIVTL